MLRWHVYRCEAFINSPLLLVQVSLQASLRGLTLGSPSPAFADPPSSPSFLPLGQHIFLHTLWCGLFDNHIWRLFEFDMSTHRGNGPFFVHIENVRSLRSPDVQELTTFKAAT